MKTLDKLIDKEKLKLVILWFLGIFSYYVINFVIGHVAIRFINYSVAMTISMIISFLIIYIWNKIIVFKTSWNDKFCLAAELLLYVITRMAYVFSKEAVPVIEAYKLGYNSIWLSRISKLVFTIILFFADAMIVYIHRSAKQIKIKEAIRIILAIIAWTLTINMLKIYELIYVDPDNIKALAAYLFLTFIIIAIILIIIRSLIIKKSAKIWNMIINIMIAFGLQSVMFFFLEYFTHSPFFDMPQIVYICNIFLYSVLLIIGCAIMGSIRGGLILHTIVVGIFALANYYVFSFRSMPLVPWDIFSVKVAASVAGNYSFMPSNRAWICIGGYLLVLLIAIFILEEGKNFNRKRLIIQGISGLVGIVLLSAFIYAVGEEEIVDRLGMDTGFFTLDDMCEVDGTLVAFSYETHFIKVKKPENYSKQECEDILSQYNYEDSNISDKKPNIIVVMIEAFSDLTVLGEYETNIDCMPYTHNLMSGDVENVVSGFANVSIKGGNTPNSEYEFLTGNSLAFLPRNSIPYQQYVHRDIPCLTSYLKDNGYKSVAMHPYYASGWSRDKVYDYMGFDDKRFIDDIKSDKYIRQYVSDEGCVDEIIKMYEAHDKDYPWFSFTVTMQNHSEYSRKIDNYEVKAYCTNSELSNSRIKNYPGLIKATDDAIEKLIEYFKNVDEDTIIMFYGDHQPSDRNVEKIWEVNGINPEKLSVENTVNRYKVPFVIWANFDINDERDIDTSLNYLAPRLMSEAGLPLPDYYNYLQALEKKYPVISGVFVKDENGKIYDVEDIKSELSEYNRIEYYNIYDKVR